VRLRRRVRGGLRWLAVAVATIWLLFPFYWLVTSSVKRGLDFYRGWVPWVNYTPTLGVWLGEFGSQGAVDRMALVNSMTIATGTTAIAVLLGGLTAYGLASIRGARVAPWLTIFCLYPRFVYPVALLIPFYLMMRFFGLIDTPFSMILGNSAFAMPFAVLIIRDAIVNVPREIEDAGLVDGCSRFQAVVRIVLPISRAGLAAAGMFAFAISLQAFLYPLVFTSSTAVKPVTLGVVTDLIRGDIFYWGELMAGALIAGLPVAILFNVFLDDFVEGITGGAFK